MDRLNKTISDVAYILDSLILLRQIQQTGDCNICKHRDCGYMPKAGQMVRYNCPFYKAESEDKGMSEISETEICSMTKEQNYMRGSKDRKNDVLDKIRAEIGDLRFGQPLRKFVVDECLEIIDKYKEG